MIGNTVLFTLIAQDEKGETKTSEIEGLVIDSWTNTHTNWENKIESERMYKLLYQITDDYQHFLIIKEWQIRRILKFAK